MNNSNEFTYTTEKEKDSKKSMVVISQDETIISKINKLLNIKDIKLVYIDSKCQKIKEGIRTIKPTNIQNITQKIAEITHNNEIVFIVDDFRKEKEVSIFEIFNNIENQLSLNIVLLNRYSADVLFNHRDENEQFFSFADAIFFIEEYSDNNNEADITNFGSNNYTDHVTEFIRNIYLMITNPGIVNLNTQELATVLKGGHIPKFGIGDGTGQNGAILSARQAMQKCQGKNPCSAFKFALVNVIGGKGVTIAETERVVQEIYANLQPDSQLIWGAQSYEKMEDDDIRTFLIMCK